MNFTEDVKNTIQHYDMIKKNGTVIVGCSGGADSIALLHCLQQLSGQLEFNILVAHINHMLRFDESDRDQSFVEFYCNENNINYKTLKIDVQGLAQLQNKNVEQCAREVRYNFFTELSTKNNSAVATAHTLNDSLETSLFNLTRGTGLTGFAGIKVVNYYNSVKVIRPLINKSRKDIEQYCAKNNLTYMFDSTNDSLKYSRNRIRHNVIPELTTVNINLLEHYKQLRDQIVLANELLLREVSLILQNAVTNNKLDLKVTKNLDNILLNQVIVQYAKQQNIMVEHIHVTKIVDSIKKGASKINLPNNNYAIIGTNYLEITGTMPVLECVRQNVNCKTGEELYIPQITDLIPNCKCGKMNIMVNLFKPNLLLDKTFKQWAVDADKLQGPCYIRAALSSDTITLQHRGCTKTVKQLKKELGLSYKERESLFVLSDDIGVFYLPLVGVDRRVVVNEKTKKYISIKFK